jgi:hypothetical protein
MRLPEYVRNKRTNLHSGWSSSLRYDHFFLHWVTDDHDHDVGSTVELGVTQGWIHGPGGIHARAAAWPFL